MSAHTSKQTPVYAYVCMYLSRERKGERKVIVKNKGKEGVKEREREKEVRTKETETKSRNGAKEPRKLCQCPFLALLSLSLSCFVSQENVFLNVFRSSICFVLVCILSLISSWERYILFLKYIWCSLIFDTLKYFSYLFLKMMGWNPKYFLFDMLFSSAFKTLQTIMSWRN